MRSLVNLTGFTPSNSLRISRFKNLRYTRVLEQRLLAIGGRHRREGTGGQSMRRQSRGETFFGGVFVKVKELCGALEQVRGEVAGVIVHPPCGVDEVYLAAGTDHF